MKSRTRDRRVVIRRATLIDDDLGKVETWADFATVWASKEDVKDAERVRAQQVGATLTSRFGCGWSSVLATVTPRDQLVCDGRTYAISATKEIGRRREIEITATVLAG